MRVRLQKEMKTTQKRTNRGYLFRGGSGKGLGHPCVWQRLRGGVGAGELYGGKGRGPPGVPRLEAVGPGKPEATPWKLSIPCDVLGERI